MFARPVASFASEIVIVSVPAAVIVPDKLLFCAAVIVTDAPDASVRLFAVNA